MPLRHQQFVTAFICILLLGGLAAFFIATPSAQMSEGQVKVEGKIELTASDYLSFKATEFGLGQ